MAIEKQINSVEQRIDETLDKMRPFLQREGGNVELDHFDSQTGIAYVKMVGACNGCYLAASDVSDSIEVIVMEEVPEVKKVELVTTQQEMSLEDLLNRLKEEESANRELEEINKNRPDR